MNAAVFLDRDNTLIHNDGDLGDPDRVQLIQGVASAVASLRGLNYRIVVVTNQGGVARGAFTEEDVDAVNQRINQLLRDMTGASIDRFYYCPYHPEGTIDEYRREHPWRKPQPGMILQAAADLDVDLSQSWMIGDQFRDIEAGKAAGVRTILLHAEIGAIPPLHQEKAVLELAEKAYPEPERRVLPNAVARSLIEAVRVIAQQRKPELVEHQRGLVKAPPMGAVASPVRLAPSRPAPEAPRPFQPVDLPREEQGNATSTRNTPVKPTGESETASDMPAYTPVRPVVKTSARHPSGIRRDAGHDPGHHDPAPKATHDNAPLLAPPAPFEDSVSEGVGGAGGGRGGSDADWDQPSRPGGARVPAAAQTLREILAEMRIQRSDGEAWNPQAVLATGLQLTACVMLAMAFFLGQGDAQVFFKWLGTALFMQLAAIAMLLFRRT